MMWPLVPNWTGGFKETLAFRTEIITSRDGTEQRRALRTTPRRTFAFNAVADGDRLRTVAAFLAGSPLIASMPEVTRGVRSTTAIPAGANSITVSSVPEWLVEGASVALSAQRRSRDFEVASVAGSVVQFTTVTDISFGTGALLSPLIAGWVSDSVSAALQTNTVATLDVDFEVAPATEAVDEGSVDYAEVFDGREVFMARPNWRQPPTITYSHDVETVDYNRGRVARFLPVEFGTRTHQGTYLNRTVEDMDYIRHFFARMKGQRGEFYMPTWLPDMTISGPIFAGAESFGLRVQGREVFDAYAADLTYKSLMLVLKDGQRIYRKVNALVFEDSSQSSAFVLNEPWVFDIAMEDVEMISWMPLCRFASDTLTIDWRTDQVAQTTLGVRTLPISDAEAPLDDLDEAAEYMISTYGWDFTLNVLYDPFQWAVNVRYPEIAS